LPPIWQFLTSFSITILIKTKMAKSKKVQHHQNQSGKDNKSKEEKGHGIISVVQSPDEETTKSGNQTQYNTENKREEEHGHGIISIVQSPDDSTTTFKPFFTLFDDKTNE
jgi:hypothetical protein